MNPDEARQLLADADDEEPIIVPASVLKDLALNDIPLGASLKIGTLKDGVYHMDWGGRLYRNSDLIEGEAEHF